jgi:hypothetical protein
MSGTRHRRSLPTTLSEDLDVERLINATQSLEDIIHKSLPLTLKTYVSLALLWHRLAAHEKYLQRTTTLEPYILIECWSETQHLKRDIAIRLIARRLWCLKESLFAEVDNMDTSLFKGADFLDNIVAHWSAAATCLSEQSLESLLHAFDCVIDESYELCGSGNNQFNECLSGGGIF